MLTTNAARETHKHLNIRLTRRTIASEISGSSGSSEYDAAADISEKMATHRVCCIELRCNS